MAANEKKERLKKKIEKNAVKLQNTWTEIENKLKKGPVTQLYQYPMKFRLLRDEYWAIVDEYAKMFDVHYTDMDKCYPMFLIEEDMGKNIVKRMLEILALIDRMIENLENMKFSIP